MPFETRIGWRLLLRGESNRRQFIFSVAFVLITFVGLGLVLISDGGSGWGILFTAVGMMGSVLCALLWLFSVLTTVSVLGVVLGVAAMTVIVAVTSGLQQQFREKVLGVNAHVTIMKGMNGFSDYRAIEDIAWKSDENVVAVQSFTFAEMQVTRGMGYLSGVAIKGVDPKRMNSVQDVHKHMVEGTVESLQRTGDNLDGPHPILLGRALARKLKATIGDTVTVVVPPIRATDTSSWEAMAQGTQSIEFEITGIFYCGFAEYDQRLMYIGIRSFQQLMDWGDNVIGVELKVKDTSGADKIADKIAATLKKRPDGADWTVQDWASLNEPLFAALTVQKIILVVILTLIIVVATFNMVSALTMMVVDKTREIAILRSMGSTTGGIMRIFQVIGLSIGGVGTICGLIIGLTLCKLISMYGYRLDPTIYYIDQLPISVNLAEVVLIPVLTVLISAIATWFPASKAANLPVVKGLRYD